MAQNSAGASAYQYSKMAEGLNAKITNLTTSWQGFTTSLVDTEFVITILEGVTGALNALTKVNSVIKTIGVTALAIVAYNKVSNFLADQKYRKNLEALALEEQVGDEARKNAIYNGRTLQEQIIKQKAKNTLLQQEIELLKKQKIALEEKAAAQKAKTGRNPRNYKKKREDLDTQIKDKQGELTQGEEDLENMEKTTGNILVKKLAMLKTDMGILFAGKKSLTDAQKKHMVENKSLLTSLKLLMTDKSKLVANEAELTLEEAQLLVMKQQAAASLATLGYALLIVAALAAVTAVVVGIVSEFKAIENSQKKIQENNNKIYELNNTKNSLQDLVDEYDQLDKKVNKTAEDLERMKELESSMREIDGVTGVSSAKERIQDLDTEIYSAQFDNLKSTLKAFMAEGSKILDFSEFTDTLNQVTDKLIASRLEYLREIKQLTVDEEVSAKRISDTVTQGINYSAVMSMAQQKAYTSRSGGERWANAGRLILGSGTPIDTIGSLITGNSD